MTPRRGAAQPDPPGPNFGTQACSVEVGEPNEGFIPNKKPSTNHDRGSRPTSKRKTVLPWMLPGGTAFCLPGWWKPSSPTLGKLNPGVPQLRLDYLSYGTVHSVSCGNNDATLIKERGNPSGFMNTIRLFRSLLTWLVVTRPEEGIPRKRRQYPGCVEQRPHRILWGQYQVQTLSDLAVELFERWEKTNFFPFLGKPPATEDEAGDQKMCY